MSYYRFNPQDELNIVLDTYPKQSFSLVGDQVTGSVMLEKEYLEIDLKNDLEERIYQGFSQRQGGYILRQGPFSASINLLSAISGSTNNETWFTIKDNLYPYYKIIDNDYTPNYTGSLSTTFRIIDIPEIYFDREILTGSLSCSDYNSAGEVRNLYDNGRGGVYSGSVSGTIVGNIFYSEGLVVLKKGDLSDFGSASSENFKWNITFKGVHHIPVKILQCRAPAGELNCSTNPTFYQAPATGDYKDQNEIVSPSKDVYVTDVGIYNEQYELVAWAKLSQPIKKTYKDSILFRLKMDF